MKLIIYLGEIVKKKREDEKQKRHLYVLRFKQKEQNKMKVIKENNN